MITITLISFSVISLLLDLFLYKRHIKSTRWWRYLYVAQAMVFDVGVFVYLAVTFLMKDTYSLQPSLDIVLLWVMFLFIMSFGAKLIMSFFSFIQWLVSRLSSRKANWSIYTGITLTATLIGAMVYGSTYGRSAIRVEHVLIESVMLPEAFDGFTIAQFSDTHIGNLGACNPLIGNMVKTINSLNPDIVVQSGDLVNIHSGELTEGIMRELATIRAPVYSVIGNHDLGYYIHGENITPQESMAKLIAKQRLLGWNLLLNEHLWLKREQDSIALAGVVYPVDKRFGINKRGVGGSDLQGAFKGVADSSFSILISHTPSLFDSVPEFAKPNLTISGHVHAMQAKISIGSWRWSPAKWLFPMWSGLWIDRGRYLYINDGMGYVLYPMRIGTCPEITLYELRRKNKNS